MLLSSLDPISPVTESIKKDSKVDLSPKSLRSHWSILKNSFDLLGEVFIHLKTFSNNSKLEFKGVVTIQVGKESDGLFINEPTGELLGKGFIIKAGKAVNNGIIQSSEQSVEISSLKGQSHSGRIRSPNGVFLFAKDGVLKLKKSKLEASNELHLKAKWIDDESSLFSGKECVKLHGKNIKNRGTRLLSDHMVNFKGNELDATEIFIDSGEFYKIYTKENANFRESTLQSKGKGLVVSQCSSVNLFKSILIGRNVTCFAFKKINLQHSTINLKEQLILRGRTLDIGNSQIRGKNVIEQTKHLVRVNSHTTASESLTRFALKIEDSKSSDTAYSVLENSIDVLREEHSMQGTVLIEQNGESYHLHHSKINSPKIVWKMHSIDGSNNHIQSKKWEVNANKVQMPFLTLFADETWIKAEMTDLSLGNIKSAVMLKNGLSELKLISTKIEGKLLAESKGIISAPRLNVSGEQLQLTSEKEIWAPNALAHIVNQIGLQAVQNAFFMSSVFHSAEGALSAEAQDLFGSSMDVKAKTKSSLTAKGALVLDRSIFNTFEALFEGEDVNQVLAKVEAHLIKQKAKKAIVASNSAITASDSIEYVSEGIMQLDGSTSKGQNSIVRKSKKGINHHLATSIAKAHSITTDFFSNRNGTLKGQLQVNADLFSNLDGTLKLDGGISSIVGKQMVTNDKSSINGKGDLTLLLEKDHVERSLIALDGHFGITAPEIWLDTAAETNSIELKATKETFHLNKRPKTKEYLRLSSYRSIDIDTPMDDIEGSLYLESTHGDVSNKARIKTSKDIGMKGMNVRVNAPVSSAGRGIFEAPGLIHINQTSVDLGDGISVKGGKFFVDASHLKVKLKDPKHSSLIDVSEFVLAADALHNPSNFHHVGAIKLIAKSALNDASNLLVEGKTAIVGTKLDNLNRTRLRSWKEQIGEITTRGWFKKRTTPVFRHRSEWVTEGVAHTQITDELSLDLDGTLQNTGVFTAKVITGCVGNLLNGMMHNVGHSPVVAGDLHALDKFSLNVTDLTHNRGNLGAGGDFSLNTNRYINERRMTTERVDAARIKSWGRHEGAAFEVDQLDEGGRTYGKKVSIKTHSGYNHAGNIEANEFLLLRANSFTNEAATIRSLHQLDFGKVSPWKSADPYSLRTDFVSAQVSSGNQLLFNIDENLRNIGSDITAMGNMSLRAGELVQRTLSSSYKSVQKKSMSESKELQSIVMCDGRIRSILGDLSLTTTKGDADLEGEFGSYLGNASIFSARDLTFRSHSRSVDNYVSSVSFTPTTVTSQTTRFNSVQTSHPHFFAGGSGIWRAERHIEGEGLQMEIGGDHDVEARKIDLHGHKTHHYQSTEGFSFGVSFTGSQAIESAFAKKPLWKTAESLLREDAALSSIIDLARSRDVVDVSLNALKSVGHLWNESAAFAKAYNQGRLGDVLGNHFGFSDEEGKFNPRYSMRFGTFANESSWTQTALTNIHIGGSNSYKAFEQSYKGVQMNVGNNANFSGDHISFLAESDTTQERGESAGFTMNMGPDGTSFGMDYSVSSRNSLSHINTRIHVGDHLHISAAEKSTLKLTLKGALLDAETCKVSTNQAEIESLQDTLCETQMGASLSTTGQFSFQHNSRKAAQVAEVSVIKARSNGTFQATALNLTGAFLQNLEVDAKKINHRDIHDYNEAESFSLSAPSLLSKPNAGDKAISIGGSFDYKNDKSEVITRATIAGSSSFVNASINTDFNRLQEQGKKSSHHYAGAAVQFNLAQMHDDINEMRKAYTYDPKPKSLLSPHYSAKLESEYSLSAKKPTENVENEKEVKEEKTKIREKDSIQKKTEEISLDSIFLSSTVKLNFINRNERQLQNRLLMRTLVTGLEIIDDAKSGAVNAICHFNPTTEKICKFTGEIKQTSIRFVRKHTPDVIVNFGNKVSKGVKASVEGTSITQERLFGIPKEETIQYYKDIGYTVNSWVGKKFGVKTTAKKIIIRLGFPLIQKFEAKFLTPKPSGFKAWSQKVDKMQFSPNYDINPNLMFKSEVFGSPKPSGFKAWSQKVDKMEFSPNYDVPSGIIRTEVFGPPRTNGFKAWSQKVDKMEFAPLYDVNSSNIVGAGILSSSKPSGFRE